MSLKSKCFISLQYFNTNNFWNTFPSKIIIFFRLSRILSPALNYCSPTVKQGCNATVNKNPWGIREWHQNTASSCKCGENSFYVPVLGSIQIRIWASLKSYSYRGCRDSSNNTRLWFTAHLAASLSAEGCLNLWWGSTSEEGTASTAPWSTQDSLKNLLIKLQTRLAPVYSMNEEYYSLRWTMHTVVLWADENSYLKHYT